jgi:serine/threonine protein kinase
MPGIIVTTGANGVSKATHGMDNRPARANAIAESISKSTSAGQARALLTEMRDTLRAQDNGDDTLLRLVHTTKTDQQMAFQSLNKKWGNSTRTLETKAALIAEFEKAGWDTTELKVYLDPMTTRGYRIHSNQILRILENASAMAETEGPDFRFGDAETTIPWSAENALKAPELGSGAFGSVQKMKFNGEPMAVKTLDATKLLPSVSLDDMQSTPHIKRATEVTAAFIKSDIKSVITPKYFMVKVTQQNGNEEQLVVKGGKDFKEWAKSQLWVGETVDASNGEVNLARALLNPPNIQVIGLAMPLAEGQPLESVLNKAQVDFKQTAVSSLNSLIQLSRHGFVHGDIKPANLILRNNGAIAMIDTGSMAKISKNAGARLLPLPSDSFDKSTRPNTPYFAHPGHPPDFQKVGMEQDLFSMGVTLLETKLLNIAKTSGGNALNDFTVATKGIFNTIKEQNDAPNSGSAATIKIYIRSKLDDLHTNYPGAFADGELDWAESVVGTALDQTSPAINREEWASVLTDLRDKVPADSADR